MWFPTKPLNIIDSPADKLHKGGVLPFIARRIVIHATGGTNSLGWLTRDSNPPVSCHRLITREGTIYKVVGDNETAYHVGFGTLFPYPIKGLMNANLTSLGIELENKNDGSETYPEAQLDSCAWQVVEWIGKFGYLPMVDHAHLDARKRDPIAFPWNEFVLLVWNRIAGLVNSELT